MSFGKLLPVALTLLAELVLCVSSAYATSSGITRRSTLQSGGCGPAGCHAASSSSVTTVRVPLAVDDKITVARGQKIRLTLTVENLNKVSVGCDISVKTTVNGSTNGGVLTAVTGQGLRVSVGELTHNSPKPLSNGKVSFEFDWTAPDADGAFYLHAAANAVNSNGSSDPNDVWNFLTPVQLVVSGTSGISEQESHVAALIAPQPAHGSVHISTTVATEGDYRLDVYNLEGILLFSDHVTSQSNFVEYDWHGTDSRGFPLPSGTYPFNISGSKAVFRGAIRLTR